MQHTPPPFSEVTGDNLRERARRGDAILWGPWAGEVAAGGGRRPPLEFRDVAAAPEGSPAKLQLACDIGNGGSVSARQCVRVVKEMDSKSIGLCPQGFESPRCRLGFGLCLGSRV